MKEFWTNDAAFHIWLDDPKSPECGAAFQLVLGQLAAMGFEVYPCERTKEKYPSLAAYHRRGHHGRLKARMQLSGRHIEVMFYQDEVIVNRNGGEYDFDRIQKMPYPVRLRWLWTRARLAALLADIGFCQRPGLPANAGPLEVFNNGWGENRFRRDESGWPNAAELDCWPRQDLDGVWINNGDTKYCQIRGRWLRCQVYGGINGMWVIWSNGTYLTTANARSLRSVFPGRGRLLDQGYRRARAKRAMEAAVGAEDFLRAHSIKKALQTA